MLKLADLENELQEEISLESFLSGFKLALGIAAELAPSYSFDDDEERQACEVLRQRRVSVAEATGQRRGKYPQAERWDAGEGRYTAGYDQDG